MAAIGPRVGLGRRLRSLWPMGRAPAAVEPTGHWSPWQPRSVIQLLEETRLVLITRRGQPVRPQQRPHLGPPHKAPVSEFDALELAEPGPAADRSGRELDV